MHYEVYALQFDINASALFLTACCGKQPLYSLEEYQFSIATSKGAFQNQRYVFFISFPVSLTNLLLSKATNLSLETLKVMRVCFDQIRETELQINDILVLKSNQVATSEADDVCSGIFKRLIVSIFCSILVMRLVLMINECSQQLCFSSNFCKVTS